MNAIRTWMTLLAAWFAAQAAFAQAPSIYITVASHIEDNAYYGHCPTYADYRERLLVFAGLLAARGIPWNLQSDYEFFHGTLDCENEAMRAQTGGTNIIHYLTTHFGVEIDAHQEGGVEDGSPDNYADVRYLGGLLTTNMSENVGGLLWDNAPQFARLATGERGRIHTNFVWFPEVLTLAVSSNHHYIPDFSMDDIAAGVWRPTGINANFWEHDPFERMIYIGPGEYSNWSGQKHHLSTPEFVAYLVESIEAGLLPATNLYAVTVAIPQRMMFDTNEHATLTALLDELEPYVVAGYARDATYSEVAAAWQDEFGSRPVIVHRCANPPRMTIAGSGEDSLSVSWMGLVGRTYTIETTTNLLADSWSAVPGHMNMTGRNATITRQPVVSEDSCVFFRVGETTDSADTNQPVITYVAVPAIGDVAVKIIPPDTPRYDGHAAAPVVVVKGFISGAPNFSTAQDFSRIGLIHITHLWPGDSDISGAVSDGEYDYAGTNGIRALAEIVKFACGQVPDRDGHYLHELVDVHPLYAHTGLFAASHPGIAVARVMAEYGLDLTNVAYFVGWENPTTDAIVSCDIGSNGTRTPINRGYHYPDDYSPTNVAPPYETLRWETRGALPYPYFDLNSNGVPDLASDYLFEPPAHRAWGLEYYSRDVLRALIANGELDPASWPTNLATLGQAEDFWAWRDPTACYPLVATRASGMAVMLVFGTRDHVQTATDKPHVHHAWQGFKDLAPSRWCRLNPDHVYSAHISAGFAAFAPDNDANLAPTLIGWRSITNWAYDSSFPLSTTLANLAAVAEMADRSRYTNWTANLTNVLNMAGTE